MEKWLSGRTNLLLYLVFSGENGQWEIPLISDDLRKCRDNGRTFSNRASAVKSECLNCLA